MQTTADDLETKLRPIQVHPIVTELTHWGQDKMDAI